ncbi:hypothetical protein A1O1_07605 [Capronia coronata CBS 617.96]|uniref:D-isomer specific 2-hydroxyacid dehydrogenase NAD-binding domain-containing protein n=1 Tax=Capronia coronata CBS 617.96 TaxID=1182541 RepID=W9XX41_9EURO|nr:uncharacterized protein A1O1_07605 [Capronia coronata CBS 617.96]EXJ81541.1 hypothetical protein A1O1_07605 [Capronia coronata CBS 617.96]
MDIVAFTMCEKRTPESRKDESYAVPGTGDPDGLIQSKWFHGATKDDLNRFLDQDLDLLVVSLPLTDLTRGMIAKEQFQILAKKKTFLCNIGWGPLVVTADLIDALEKGLVRAAALNVTDPESLPKGHPLWRAPNLLSRRT